MSDPIMGRDVTVEVILAPATGSKTNGVYAAPTTGWIPLGGTRGLSKGAEWDTVDTTSRSSTGNVRQSAVTFLSASGSVDGTYINATAENIIAMDEYVNAPASGQPNGWIRLSYPSPTSGNVIRQTLYCLFKSFNIDAPYDDQMTFTMDYEGKQPWQKTDVDLTP